MFKIFVTVDEHLCYSWLQIFNKKEVKRSRRPVKVLLFFC